MINDVYAAINFKAFTTKIHDVARDQFLFIVTEDECNKKAVPIIDKGDEDTMEDQIDTIT